MAKGIFAFYGITTGETYSVASSYSKSLHMPFINPNYPRNISRTPYKVWVMNHYEVWVMNPYLVWVMSSFKYKVWLMSSYKK